MCIVENITKTLVLVEEHLCLFTVSMDVIVSFRDKRFLGSWHQYSSKVSY
jgi:hypothetical protein